MKLQWKLEFSEMEDKMKSRLANVINEKDQVFFVQFHGKIIELANDLVFQMHHLLFVFELSFP